MKKFYILCISTPPDDAFLPLDRRATGNWPNWLASRNAVGQSCRTLPPDSTEFSLKAIPEYISFAIDIEAFCAGSAALYPMSISEAKPLSQCEVKESRKVCAWAKGTCYCSSRVVDPNGTLMSRSTCFLIFCENPEIQQVAANYLKDTPVLICFTIYNYICSFACVLYTPLM